MCDGSSGCMVNGLLSYYVYASTEHYSPLICNAILSLKLQTTTAALGLVQELVCSILHIQGALYWTTD